MKKLSGDNASSLALLENALKAIRSLADIQDTHPEVLVTGPDRTGEEYDIDTVFGKIIDDVLSDMMDGDGHTYPGVPGYWRKSDIEPALREMFHHDEELSFLVCDAGSVICLRNGRPVGALNGFDISVAFEEQGAGIGQSLILAGLAESGELAFWHADKLAYSPEGARCLERAGERLAELANHIARDIDLMREESSPEPPGP